MLIIISVLRAELIWDALSTLQENIYHDSKVQNSQKVYVG